MTDVVTVREDGTLRVQLLCEDKSLTRQSEAGACDINRIMATYEKTGVLPEGKMSGVFADVSEYPSYQDVMQHIAEASSIFSHLPAALRTRFDNDPAVFLDFASNPQNEDEMRRIGLLPALEEPVPVPKAEDPPAPVGG